MGLTQRAHLASLSPLMWTWSVLVHEEHWDGLENMALWLVGVDPREEASMSTVYGGRGGADHRGTPNQGSG